MFVLNIVFNGFNFQNSIFFKKKIGFKDNSQESLRIFFSFKTYVKFEELQDCVCINSW